MKKIEIKPSEAAEWMEKGFEIECYVLVAPTKQKATKRRRCSAPRNAPVPKTAMLTLSIDGTEPGHGLLGATWEKVKKDLWGKNPGKQYSRLQLEQKCAQHGGLASHTSEFLYRYKGVRVING